MFNKPEKINYNAYTADQEDILPRKSNIKESLLKKSRFAKEDNEDLPKRTASDFDKDVIAYKQNELDIKNKIVELTNAFKKLLKNTSLEENKGPAEIDYEKEIINSICDLGLRMNNDDQKPEGIGSIGLNRLLFSAVLIQRDSINKLSHDLFILKKSISEVLKILEEDDEK